MQIHSRMYRVQPTYVALFLIGASFEICGRNIGTYIGYTLCRRRRFNSYWKNFALTIHLHHSASVLGDGRFVFSFLPQLRYIWEKKNSYMRLQTIMKSGNDRIIIHRNSNTHLERKREREKLQKPELLALISWDTYLCRHSSEMIFFLVFMFYHCCHWTDSKRKKKQKEKARKLQEGLMRYCIDKSMSHCLCKTQPIEWISVAINNVGNIAINKTVCYAIRSFTFALWWLPGFSNETRWRRQ